MSLNYSDDQRGLPKWAIRIRGIATLISRDSMKDLKPFQEAVRHDPVRPAATDIALLDLQGLANGATRFEIALETWSGISRVCRAEAFVARCAECEVVAALQEQCSTTPQPPAAEPDHLSILQTAYPSCVPAHGIQPLGTPMIGVASLGPHLPR